MIVTPILILIPIHIFILVMDVIIIWIELGVWIWAGTGDNLQEFGMGNIGARSSETGRDVPFKLSRFRHGSGHRSVFWSETRSERRDDDDGFRSCLFRFVMGLEVGTSFRGTIAADIMDKANAVFSNVACVCLRSIGLHTLSMRELVGGGKDHLVSSVQVSQLFPTRTAAQRPQKIHHATL